MDQCFELHLDQKSAFMIHVFVGGAAVWGCNSYFGFSVGDWLGDYGIEVMHPFASSYLKARFSSATSSFHGALRHYNCSYNIDYGKVYQTNIFRYELGSLLFERVH